MIKIPYQQSVYLLDYASKHTRKFLKSRQGLDMLNNFEHFYNFVAEVCDHLTEQVLEHLDEKLGEGWEANFDLETTTHFISKQIIQECRPIKQIFDNRNQKILRAYRDCRKSVRKHFHHLQSCSKA